MKNEIKIGSFIKIKDNVNISRPLYDHISRSKFIRVLWMMGMDTCGLNVKQDLQRQSIRFVNS